MLLAFDDEQKLASELATALACPLQPIQRHRFPDAALRLVLPQPLPPAGHAAARPADLLICLLT